MPAGPVFLLNTGVFKFGHRNSGFEKRNTSHLWAHSDVSIRRVQPVVLACTCLEREIGGGPPVDSLRRTRPLLHCCLCGPGATCTWGGQLPVGVGPQPIGFVYSLRAMEYDSCVQNEGGCADWCHTYTDEVVHVYGCPCEGFVSDWIRCLHSQNVPPCFREGVG